MMPMLLKAAQEAEVNENHEKSGNGDNDDGDDGNGDDDDGNDNKGEDDKEDEEKEKKKANPDLKGIRKKKASSMKERSNW